MNTTTIQGTACQCIDSLHLGHLPQNVGEWERLASVAAGGGLIALGLRQCSLSGLLLGGVGAGLLYRGLTGHCHLYQALGTSALQDAHGHREVTGQRGPKAETHSPPLAAYIAGNGRSA